MIGNDIVDLAQAKQESNWRRKGFSGKVFTDYEQQLICTASDPDRMVWLLWSMKESACKAVARQTGKRLFAPWKIACHVTFCTTEKAEGLVFYEGIHKTRSLITDQYIATTARSTSTFEPVNHTIVVFDTTTYQTQHTTIWKKLTQLCARHFTIPETSVHSHKNDIGVPGLTIDDPSGTTLYLPLSISHHGHYGAYVIDLPPVE